jgi:mannose-6-phosphate isomerase-like protein (cupin superfamily)
MKIVRAKNLPFVPASHENPQNPGVLKKILLKKEDLVKGKIQMVNWARIPTGKTFQPHYHQSMEEIFIIVSGKAKIFVGEEEAVLRKGDAVIIPVGQVHKMTNISQKDVDYLVIGIVTGESGKTVVVRQ